MIVLAFAIFLLLTAIAGLHVAWGCGVVWPRRTESELAATVVGYRSDKMPVPAHCFIAALAIYTPGAIALMLAGLLETPLPPWLIALSGAGVIAVFAGRGIAGYLPQWRARFSRQPFAGLDRMFYSPLCVLLAVGFLILLLNGLDLLNGAL